MNVMQTQRSASAADRRPTTTVSATNQPNSRVHSTAVEERAGPNGTSLSSETRLTAMTQSSKEPLPVGNNVWCTRRDNDGAQSNWPCAEMSGPAREIVVQPNEGQENQAARRGMTRVRFMGQCAGHVVLVLLAWLGLSAQPAEAQTPPPETIEYYATDALGSVRVVFTPTGQVLGRSDYLPFGETLNQSGALPHQRFTGQERDGEAGLDYFNARSLQARTGRMNRPDPLFGNALTNPQRWNRYAYVLDNPLTFTDPTGLDASNGCTTTMVKNALGVVTCPGGSSQGSDSAGTDGTDLSAAAREGMSDLMAGQFGSTGGGDSGVVGVMPGHLLTSKPIAIITPPPTVPPPPAGPPPLPHGVTVEQNMATTLDKVRSVGTVGALRWWIGMVSAGSQWDYKVHGGTEYAGNFNFGATAYALGLSLGFTTFGSEYAQMMSGLNKLFNAVVDGGKMPGFFSFVDTAGDMQAYSDGYLWAASTWPDPIRRR
jgi:RHS repeat-associated protein